MYIQFQNSLKPSVYMVLHFITFYFSDCTVYINSRRVACASGGNQKIAKKEAAAIALEHLRKYYYTIKVKSRKYEFTLHKYVTKIAWYLDVRYCI